MEPFREKKTRVTHLAPWAAELRRLVKGAAATAGVCTGVVVQLARGGAPAMAPIGRELAPCAGLPVARVVEGGVVPRGQVHRDHPVPGLDAVADVGVHEERVVVLVGDDEEVGGDGGGRRGRRVPSPGIAPARRTRSGPCSGSRERGHRSGGHDATRGSRRRRRTSCASLLHRRYQGASQPRTSREARDALPSRTATAWRCCGSAARTLSSPGS